MKRIWILAAIAAVGFATQSDAFVSRNGDRVNQVNDVVFEVIPKSKRRSFDYWCSASQYARRVLGAGWRQEVYISRGYGPSETTGRRTAIQFTLDPQAAGVTPLESVFRVGLKVGDSMSIQQANGFCGPGISGDLN